jgi:membrane protease YdiL (CAAX protease family)
MTFKRLILILSTVVAVFLAGVSLFSSWQEPQFQSRLELFQTDIVLQAATWEPQDDKDNKYASARDAILGTKPLESATKQYEEAQKSAKAALEKAENSLDKLRQPPALPLPKPQIQTSSLGQLTSQPSDDAQQVLLKSLAEQRKVLAEIDLRLGILQAQQEKTQSALKTWDEVTQKVKSQPELTETSEVLAGLWNNSPRLLPNAPELIKANLNGWFRFTALSRLYTLQQRDDAMPLATIEDGIASLKASQQAVAEQALLKLTIVGVLPNLAALLGIGLLIFLIAQRVWKGKESILARNGQLTWSTPWDGETILQVFVIGFFLMGQLLIPVVFKLIFSILPIPRPTGGNIRLQALYVLVSYLLVAAGSVGVLYLSIKPFLPLPDGWFRFRLGGKWFLWGFGGYCVALPIVLLVSLINQQIWKGQGGSNPLLQLALEGQDSVALGIFFVTAAIAAPLFEEFLFRGFLLPSLTRYIPVWGSILLSAFLFAAAHLSLSEILPLFSLGIVLGVVYTRSRNLLAPMLLHSLWNSGTLLTLFTLGSSNN